MTWMLPIVLILFYGFDCAKAPVLEAKEPTFVSFAPVAPILKGLAINPCVRITVAVPQGGEVLELQSLRASLNTASVAEIRSVDVFISAFESQPVGRPIASIDPSATEFDIPLTARLEPGLYWVWLSVLLEDSADLDGLVELHAKSLTDKSGKSFPIAEEASAFAKRKGQVLRKSGDEGVDTYRIPGIVRTQQGTLIAVYDIRYINSRDLPGNIDVGMSRSTDGGQTWEPMRIIMDMGAPHDNNGVGDPCILVDPATGTIWVAALWSKGNRSIAGSGPGLSPDETGQFVLASSSDDGITWSNTYTITPQIKKPEWRIFFQGPGSGIAMQDGTLVFPAQYWDANGMPWSNLIYSKDHGKSWKCAAAAPKSNTTESQVVETTPGTLLLNMRDNRGQFRSVATTTDLGTTWTEHPSSYKLLPDPVCMGSLIKSTLMVNGVEGTYLFFCNPDKPAAPRENITVKVSADMGTSWPASRHLLIDSRPCYGYSSMAMVDNQTLGLLYEGEKNLYFVRIPVADFFAK